MNRPDDLLARNRAWSERVRQADPNFFSSLVAQQSPEYLWIGCSDSRVPANEIIGMAPGEVFVHRNVANLVVHSDLNCLSVIQYAVEVLRVKHILVVGHYGCGGVNAALQGLRFGLVDNWLRHVQDIRDRHLHVLNELEGETRGNRMCELNVLEQTLNVCETTILRDAWTRGQDVAVHAWVYGLHDGRVRDLGMSVNQEGGAGPAYDEALASLLR